MSKEEILNKLHQRIINDVLSKNPGGNSKETIEKCIVADNNLRKAIAELYMNLSSFNDSKFAVDILTEHLSMMVDMIESFRGKKQL